MADSTQLQSEINSIIELFSSGRIKEALSDVETLTIKHQKEPLLYNISGVCLKTIGELEMAVKSFEKAIVIKPNFTDAHYNLGLTLYELNQMQAAINSYEKALTFQPNYAEVHNNLGIAQRELGQINDAIKSYEKVLSINPDYAEAHNNLGNALYDRGELDEAINHYHKVIAIQPNNAEAHHNLGNTLNELGQTDEAIKSYKKTLSIAPDYIDAHNNLGNILKELGQTDEAIKCYEKALAINPEYAEGHNNLGNALKDLGQFNDAVIFYKQALAINPSYDDAQYNLGVSHHELGKTEEARKCYELVLAINPYYADAHNNLGNILKELGQTDDAFNCYVQALAIQPDNTQIHRNFGMMKHYKEGDTQFTHMQSLLSTDDLTLSDRAHLCFALAKAYDDLGNNDELFKVLNEGNELRKQELNYSIESDLEKHSIYTKLFKSASKKSYLYEKPAVSPIFIVGMPRSGTTLVEQIISSHHKVHGAGELLTLNNLIAPIISDHLTHNNILSEKNFMSIRQGYLDNLFSFNASESIITDKMPTNFENIGFILKAFPEAKIIHLKRDAMAICWSIYQRYFPATGLGFPYNMEDLAKFYNSYTEMMDFWHKLFPNQIYDISYEDLTTNQEEETKKLLEYCELDWDENCLNFHTNKRAVKTTSSMQVRQKMYQGSSEAWKKYEGHLTPLTKALGY